MYLTEYNRGKISTPHHERFGFAGYPRERDRKCFGTESFPSQMLPRPGYSGIFGSLQSPDACFFPLQAHLFSDLTSQRTGSSSWLGKFANVFSTFNTGKLQIGIPNNPKASSQHTYPWQEETVTIFFLPCGLRVKKITCITTQGGNLG